MWFRKHFEATTYIGQYADVDSVYILKPRTFLLQTSCLRLQRHSSRGAKPVEVAASRSNQPVLHLPVVHPMCVGFRGILLLPGCHRPHDSIWRHFHNYSDEKGISWGEIKIWNWSNCLKLRYKYLIFTKARNISHDKGRDESVLMIFRTVTCIGKNNMLATW